VLGLAGGLTVATRWLPLAPAGEVALTRGGPVLVFLAAITVLAELADSAGVFDAAAGVCARAVGGSTWRLFLLIAALGTLTTIRMSLDTTAVLLTPVVLALAARLGLRPLPFALLAVWLPTPSACCCPCPTSPTCSPRSVSG
jgi:arsenical pump membrane protein